MPRSNPLLTLPPEVGKKYRYRSTKEDHGALPKGEESVCEITHTNDEEGEEALYFSRDSEGNNWVYSPDGYAKIGLADHCAVLIEDVNITPNLPESEEFKHLRKNHKAMMRRLKELGA